MGAFNAHGSAVRVMWLVLTWQVLMIGALPYYSTPVVPRPE